MKNTTFAAKMMIGAASVACGLLFAASASANVKFFSRSLLPNKMAAGEEPSASPSFLTVTWLKSLS